MDLPPDAAVTTVAAEVLRPYVGARPFEDRDEAFFFGRKRDAAHLSNIVAAATLTVVYGPSGAGKSSLLNTRLMHGLELIEQCWIPIWFSSWQTGFEAAFLHTVHDALRKQGEDLPPDTAMPQLASALLGLSRETGRPMVLVLDQFEEYFLYNGTGATGFETMLARLCNRRHSPIRVVLSLRSDRLFLLDRLRSRIPDILQSLFVVDPLDETGAREAVINPLAVYSERAGSEVTIAAEVVDAIVRGADEREMRQRLPFRGRGVARPAGDAARHKLRIVAPFMQLALESLWNQDIVARRGTAMTLPGLYELAKAHPEAPAASLVGLIAQRHLDSLLERFSNDEQTVCAKLFDRMVTFAGGKVAVTVPYDFAAVLDPAQLDTARSLLEVLAEPGPSRLVRRVATDDPLLPDDPASAAPMRFEIVHDALAIPILDWVSRWRDRQTRKEAAAREKEASAKALERAQARTAAERAQRQAAEAKARRRIAAAAGVLALVCAVFLSVGGYLKYNDRKVAIERFSLFAEKDSTPEFRLRLLLLVSSLSQASGPWSLVLKHSAAAESLRHTLASSPRWGGSGLAVGLDESGSRLAVLTKDGELKETVLLTGAQRPAADPQYVKPFLNPAKLSSLPLQSRWQPYAVGYLHGIKHPVFIAGGILHYLPNSGGSEWKSVDLADWAPADFGRLPGFLRVEIAAGAVQITESNLGKEQRVLRLRPMFAKDGSPTFSRPGFMPPDIQGQGLRYPPALSPWMNTAPHDRFAFREPVQSSAGQLIARPLKVGSIEAQEPSQTLRDPDSQTKEELGEAAEVQSSLAFSDDQSALVVRAGPKISIVPLDATSSSARTLAAPKDAGNTVVLSFPGRPLLAAVHASGPEYRIAWLSPQGIVLLRSDASESLIKDRVLFSGPGDGYRLNFSPDGSRLMLVGFIRTSEGPPQQQARVWDLRTEWQGEVLRTEDKSKLVAMACEEAKLENPGHTSLSDDEKITWQAPNGEQPCVSARESFDWKRLRSDRHGRFGFRPRISAAFDSG